MRFLHPEYLFLLLLLIPIVAWYIWEMRKSDASMQISTHASISHLSSSYRAFITSALLAEIAVLDVPDSWACTPPSEQ